MTRVSVVVPTRDRSALLWLGLRSALAQRGVDVDVVVVDDASTDGTAAMVEGLDDDRVRLLRHTRPRGVSAARNAGLAAAEGEWVAFLDDDDLWAPDKLARQLAAATATRRDWVYAGDVCADRNLLVLAGGMPPDPQEVVAGLPRYNPVPSGASNVVVRRELLERVGGFDPGLRRTEDWDLWIRLARQGPPAWVPSPLVAFRVHPGNAPVAVDSMVAEPALLARRYGIPVDMAAMHRRAAWTALRGGNWSEAARHYLRAVARGDLVSAGRLAVALTNPAARGVELHRARRPGPEERRWQAEAQVWLDALAQLDRSASVAGRRA